MPQLKLIRELEDKNPDRTIAVLIPELDMLHCGKAATRLAVSLRGARFWRPAPVMDVGCTLVF